MSEDECSADLGNSLRITTEGVVIMERTKLNPQFSHKKKKINLEANGCINTIKLASKGFKGRNSSETHLNAEDRKTL
jgi:hypothetical protein